MLVALWWRARTLGGLGSIHKDILEKKGHTMTTNQVLVIVGLAIVAVLLVVLLVTVRRRKARAFAALTPQERELTYARSDYTKRVSELKDELKATEKESRKRTKRAEDKLNEATKIGSDKIASLKGKEGTVMLTALVLTTPSSTHNITPQTTASVAATGSAPASDGESDTRRAVLSIQGDGINEAVTFAIDEEADARGLAAKISSAAAHVGVLNSQRDDAIEAAEAEVAEANANATIEANNAQARYDAAEKESMATVRAAEDAVRSRGINPK